MKKYLVTIGGLFAILFVLVGVKGTQIMTLMVMAENMQMPATVVSASVVEEQEWEITLNSVGSLEAVQGVMVTADTPGRVTEILFEAGASVDKGEVLLKQDTSIEEAQLRAAEASASLAKVNLDRLQELLKKQASSKSEFDAAEARYKEAVAQADNIRAVIDKKTVRAPFAGRLGIRMVNVGASIGSGDPIVSLQAVNPIYVNFSLPQREVSQVQNGYELRMSTDAVPGGEFSGLVTAINPQIDPMTRSVSVQATLENLDGKLLPGMFAKVEVVLPEKEKVLAVPSTAVAYATYGDSIFKVVDKKSEAGGSAGQVAEQSFVRLGKARGDYVSVLKGVEPGDVVVSTGVFKLLNGAPVAVNNEHEPEYSLDPKPDNS